jgi:spermidine/putrescine transport system permease protein
MSSPTQPEESNIARLIRQTKNGNVRKLVKPPTVLLLPYSLLLLVAFIGPIAAVVVYSFSANQLNLTLTGWTLDNYIILAGDSLFRSIAVNTLKLSTASTLLAFLISYPAAYGLARKVKTGEFLLVALMIMPLFTSVNIRVYGWFLTLIQDGIITGVMGVFGVTDLPQMIYKEWTVVLGITYVYLPYMLFPIYISFSNIDNSLVEAAHDLGASRLQVFKTVIFPHSKPGIVVGIAFTFILSLGAHVEGTVLGGNTILMLASELQHSFGYAQNWATGSAQAMIMLVIALVAAFVILGRIDFAELSSRGN